MTLSLFRAVEGLPSSTGRHGTGIPATETGVNQTNLLGRWGQNCAESGRGNSENSVSDWCERGDLNPHGFPRWILSPVRLPIPPLSRAHSMEFKPYLPPRHCVLCGILQGPWHSESPAGEVSPHKHSLYRSYAEPIVRILCGHSRCIPSATIRGRVICSAIIKDAKVSNGREGERRKGLRNSR